MISIAKPKLSTCWYCEKPESAAAWSGPRAVCARCVGFMAQGVICIGVSAPLSSDTVVDKVYRDGNWCVLSRGEYERRLGAAPPPEGHVYVDRARWQRSGLPKFGKHGASHEYGDVSGEANEGEYAARVA